MIFWCFIPSPLGRITAVSQDGFLTGLWLPGQPSTVPSDAVYSEDAPVLLELKQWLSRYFAGESMQAASLPLRPQGTTFQQAVWQKLLAIPYGGSTTYGALAGELARESGKPKMSAQAVGQAVGRNPISIVIPCHRVLGASGALTGYAGGIHYKKQLLELEHIPYRP